MNKNENSLLDNIALWGNKNSNYMPFVGGCFYPLRTQDFIRTGFMDIAPTLQSRDYKDPKCVMVEDSEMEKHNGYAIRKLTPKECFRLMDFNEGAYDLAEKVNSNTQLYKQAGNSIVVNVLVAILGQLIEGHEDDYKRINNG